MNWNMECAGFEPPTPENLAPQTETGITEPRETRKEIAKTHEKVIKAITPINPGPNGIKGFFAAEFPHESPDQFEF